MAEKSLEELVARKKRSAKTEEKKHIARLIKASIKTDGVVERSDVVGAIFGQTESLLDESLNLRELQKSGLIGRIDVEIESEKGKSKGTISIPSSLDDIKTAIIGASLEAIERVGPCEAEIKIEKVEDIRNAKRKFIVDRAKKLLKDFKSGREVGKRPSGPKKEKKVIKYKGQPAGPSASKSDAIIIVEGRADVINMLKCGIKNTVAIEGTNVPPSISEISENKTVTAFLDGDRGGDLILKELLQVANLDYVARAPPNKNVEDLSEEELRKALKNKVPVEKASTTFVSEVEEISRDIENLASTAEELRGTLKAKLFDDDMNVVGEHEVRGLTDRLEEVEDVKAVVFDGIVTQKLADAAEKIGLKYLVGMRDRAKKKGDRVQILTPESLKRK